jgi:hypothetical protein
MKVVHLFIQKSLFLFLVHIILLEDLAAPYLLVDGLLTDSRLVKFGLAGFGF